MKQAAERCQRLLKQLARDLDIPVIAASQLRRDAEGKKPQLSDFSDSTQLERDADVAMAIYNLPKFPDGTLEVGKNSFLSRILKNVMVRGIFALKEICNFMSSRNHQTHNLCNRNRRNNTTKKMKGYTFKITISMVQ